MDLNMEGGRKETDEEGIVRPRNRQRLTRLKRQEQNDT